MADAAPTIGPTTRAVRRRVVTVPATQLAANPLPGIAAQQQARAKIREIYAADFADSSFAARRALARRLIGASNDTKRDSDAKFVLLREARDLAADGGDVLTAFDAVDHLVHAFPVSRLTERIDVMRSAVPVLSTPQANLAATSICMDLMDQCIIEGDYDRADLMASLAATSARQGKSPPYAKWVESRAAALRPLKEAYEITRPAEVALSRAPHDRQANFVVGKFVAFIKSDLDAGLTMLAKGSDAPLAALAEQDLTTSDRPADQFKTAGAWWEMSESQAPDYRDAMRRRAGFWYRRATSGLDGLDKAMAERRLLSLNPPSKPNAKREHPPDALRLTATRWYRASIAEVSWENAQRLCAESGGQLVCIETRLEGELMAKLARGRMLWLGASTEGNGKWSWLNSAEFFYSAWSSGEPSNFTPDAHPVTTPNGAWQTWTGKAGFICEWSE